MKVLLDTNVLSDSMRPEPNFRVARWLEQFELEDLYTTAISLAELYRGAALLPASARQARFHGHALRIETQLCRDRVLPFTRAEASIFATIQADRNKLGRPISIADAMIAAIALVHRMTLATRNTRDFEHLGIDLVDPFG